MAEGLCIASVRPGSIAEELGLEKGDFLLSLNGRPVEDALDYLLACDDEHLVLTARSPSGEELEAEIERDPREDLGLTFARPHLKVCENHCIFCFVDQMPPGFRKTLYLKDDDWRTSFLHGSYITLTNLREADLARIRDMKVSPLYVSVHAVRPAVRRKLLGSEKGGDILPVLQSLVQAGIRIYAQAVIVPGINDGEVLEETISALADLSPHVISLAVVPVGLTSYRGRCAKLQAVDREGARRILGTVDRYQKRCLERLGTRFVFAADELYVTAGIPFPPACRYEDFSQMENGVGLAADFLAGARRAISCGGRPDEGSFLFVTGRAFEKAAEELAGEIRRELHVDVAVHGVDNRTFGPACNVAGLLTGRDVISSLKGKASGRTVLLPPVMFRDGGDVTIDNMSCGEIAAGIGAPCTVPPPGGWNFVRSLIKGGNEIVKAAGGHCGPPECR